MLNHDLAELDERIDAASSLERGFALPTVILMMVLVSALGLASLLTTRDEWTADRALRESAKAFYAAEAGANAVFGTWDRAAYDTLLAVPGDSVDLGWQTLENGSSYRAVVHRVDDGSFTKKFRATVTGRGVGALSGQRIINISLMTGDPICCSAAVRGKADFEIDKSTVSGFDSIPAAWAGAGVCSNTLEDKPGLLWNGPVDLDSATITGVPPLVNDATIDSTNLFVWGDMTYDDLVAMADINITGDVGQIGPTTTGGGSKCQTSNLFNWGAPEDPSSPCFDYFPIIHAEQLDIETNSTGQGILLVDSELEIEVDGLFTFYGIIIVKDETEFEDGVKIHGGLIINGEFEAEDGPFVQYSQCAANRALEANGLPTSEMLANSWSQAL